MICVMTQAEHQCNQLKPSKVGVPELYLKFIFLGCVFPKKFQF